MTKLLYVDLETGGLPVSTGIYEVGLIATDNGRILETLTIGLPINKDRIPEGMGQGYACISDDEVYINQFKRFVAKYPYPFVAHNASFDRGFLVRYGWVNKDAEFIDTYALFRQHLPKSEITNYKLGTIMEYYDVQVDGTLHTAISDLKGLVECVNKSGILGDFSGATTVDIKLKPNGTQFMRTEGSVDVTYKEIDKAVYTELVKLPHKALETAVKQMYRKEIEEGYTFYGCGLEQLNQKYYVSVSFSVARNTSNGGANNSTSVQSSLTIAPYEISDVVGHLVDSRPDFENVIHYFQNNRHMEYERLTVMPSSLKSEKLKAYTYSYKNFEAVFNEDFVSFDVHFTDLSPLKYAMSDELYREWLMKVDNHLEGIMDMGITVKVPDLPTTSVENASAHEKMKSTMRRMNVKVPTEEFSERFLAELTIKVNQLDAYSHKILRQLHKK